MYILFERNKLQCEYFIPSGIQCFVLSLRLQSRID